MSSNKTAEITAEWTVHAQLTISRPGDPSKKTTGSKTNIKLSNQEHDKNDSSSADPGAADDKQQSATSAKPVKIVYKWSTDDNGQQQTQYGNGDGHSMGDKPKNNSFKSMGTDGKHEQSESGCSAEANITVPTTHNHRCRSTCSIILSADLYPNVNEPEKAYGTYNTATSCTLSPDTPEITKSLHFHSVKDAFSQTSDQESKQKPIIEDRRRRSYNYRRCLTDSICSADSMTKSASPGRTPPTIITTFEEGTQKSPSHQPSRSPLQIRQMSPATNRTFSTSPQPKVARQTASTVPKKSPRTVHIDVYCTGSEAEDTSATSSQSTSPSLDSSCGNNNFDEESNSTPQTVLETKFNHNRITDKNELPRRIANQFIEKQQKSIISPAKLRQFLIENATSKDEINESKHILFRKHMGESDLTKHTVNPTKSSSTKNRFAIQKDGSEDGLSSNYPNSSRSTVRDLTSSSISSALASSSAVYEDLESWKENDTNSSGYHYGADSISTAPSESFEYDNSTDRARILQMEQLWNQQTAKGWRSMGKERRFMLQQRKMIDFMHENEKQMMERTEDDVNSDNEKVVMAIETEALNESQVCHAIYNNVTGVPKKQCCRPSDILLGGGIQITDASFVEPTPGKHKKILFTPSYSPSSQASSILTINATSTNIGNPWERAQKFGNIVMGSRGKNGRHFGPAKNPDCQCDHCRHWAAEREQFRNRALSMGDVPYNRSGFWLRRQQH